MIFTYFLPFPFNAKTITFSVFDLSNQLSFIKGLGLRQYLTPITFSISFLIIYFLKNRIKYLIVAFIFIIYYFFRHSVTHALSSFFYLFFFYMFTTANSNFKTKRELAWQTLGFAMISTGLHKINPYFLNGDSFKFSGHFFNLTQQPLQPFIFFVSRFSILPYLIVTGEILIGLLLLFKFRFSLILLTLTTAFFSLFYGRIFLVLLFFVPLFLVSDIKTFVVISRFLFFKFKIKIILIIFILLIFILKVILPIYFFFSVPILLFILFFNPKCMNLLMKLKVKNKPNYFESPNLKHLFSLFIIIYFASTFIFKLPEPYGLSMFSSKDKINNKFEILSYDKNFCTMFQRLFYPGFTWGTDLIFLGPNISSGCRITTINHSTSVFIKSTTCKYLSSCSDSLIILKNSITNPL